MGDDETIRQVDGDSSQLGDKWGDEISDVRKAELEARLQQWASEVDHGTKRGPFDGEKLTGADVFWLSARSMAGTPDERQAILMRYLLRSAQDDVIAHQNLRTVCALHLEGADLRWAHLKAANLYQAHLEGAHLFQAHLDRALFSEAHLEGTDFTAAQLQEAYLSKAHLEGAIFIKAHLEGANFTAAYLEGAELNRAYLQGAHLEEAHLEGAILSEAHLEGADLSQARLNGKRMAKEDFDLLRIQEWRSDFPTELPPTDLRLAFFDRATQLNSATLGDADLGYVQVADTHWGDVNLAVVDWSASPIILRDEYLARAWKSSQDTSVEVEKPFSRQALRQAQRKQSDKRLNLYRSAARAYRQLAAALRGQGLNDEADRFAYKAQGLQRTVLRLQRKYLRWLWSWFLELLAGYGYEPIRTLGVYLGVVFMFASYYQRFAPAAHLRLSFLAALVMSVASFHGRGFFPTPTLPLDSPIAVCGAIEAVIGLVIEASFIATFTQRFFAR